MNRVNLINKIIMMPIIFLLIVGLPSNTSTAATANLSNDIISATFTDINQNSALLEIETASIKEADQLYYLLVDSKNPLTGKYDDPEDLYKVDTNNDGIYDQNQEQYLVVDPYDALYSDYNTETALLHGQREINSGSTITLNLDNRIRSNTNYHLYLVASHENPGLPVYDDLDTSQNLSTHDEYLHVTFNGTDYDVRGTNGTADQTVSEAPDGSVNIEINNSGTDLGLDFSGKSFKEGDAWIVNIEDGLVKDVKPKPHAEFIQTSKIQDGELKFSTDTFPDLIDGFGYENQTGFYVSGSPSVIRREWNYTRGVLSGTTGEVKVSFEADIKLTEKDVNIQIIDTLTNEDYAKGTPQVTGNTLTVTFKALEPNRQYYVNIPDGALATNTGTFNLGEFNAQVFDRLIFYTEKKPSTVSAYFSPGADFFNPDASPFRMSSSQEIYQIPELIGVHKIGVGINQALIVQFDDKISNLNPGKVDVSTNPISVDLNYNVEINEQNPTEIVISFDTAHPDRLLEFNTKYTVTIESGAFKDRYGGGVYAENDKMIIKFKTADGFNNAFIQKTAQELNSGILQTPSHNIAIDIPKIYVKELETIHYRDGLIAEDRTAPNLTNIDIAADEDVARISIVTDRGIRPNLQRSSNGKFSTTFAGLNADVTDIEVTAYDEYGKVLERRSFRLQGAPGAEFKNDYVPQITNNFGKIVSLYDLMKDPQIMEDVLEQIPVSELDRIGVFHPYFEPYDLLMR